MDPTFDLTTTSPLEFVNELDAEEALDLARRILDLDNSELSVLVVSHLGFPIAWCVSKSYQSKLSSSKEYWEISAQRAATIMGAAKGEDPFHSPIESIALGREESKSLLIWIPRHALILKVLLVRSADAAKVTDKIRKMFGF